MQHKSDMAKALDSARKEREKHLEEIRRLDIFIQVAERLFDSMAHGEQGELEGMVAESSEKHNSERFKGKSMAEAAEIILREHGRPLHVKAMLQLIANGGYPKPKYVSLYPTLKRRPAFYKAGEAKFGLTEWKEKKAPS